MMRRHTPRSAFFGLLLAAALLSACGQEATPTAMDAHTGQSTTLTSRADIFASSQYEQVQVSPDAEHIAWIGPAEGGQAVWVAPLAALDERRMLELGRENAAQGPILTLRWAANNTHVVVDQYSLASQSSRVFSVNIYTGEVVSLDADGAVDHTVIGISLDFPDELVIGAQKVGAAGPDLYRVNVINGRDRRILRNTEGISTFSIDSQLRPRLSFAATPDGGSLVRVRGIGNDAPWRELIRWAPEDAALSRLVGFDGSERAVYAVDSTGSDTRALVRVDVATGERDVLGSVTGADVDSVILHPATKAVDAFSVERLRQEWIAVSPTGAVALARIQDAVSTSFDIVSRSLDDRIWIIHVKNAQGDYLMYNHQDGSVAPIFQAHAAQRPQVASTPVIIGTPDGLDLVAHLTLPPSADADGDGTPDAALPAIISLHQGPWGRSRAGYEETAAWLADRGYAVIALNTRGSQGFGKTFVNAGAGEWGGAVQSDVLAAANWAIDKGVTEPGKVGVFGQFLGGHAGLVALERHPEVFACAAAIDPPADPLALAADPPARLAALKPLLAWMLGDPDDPQTRQIMATRTFAAIAPGLTRPALILTNVDDPMLGAPEILQTAQSAAEEGAPISVLTLSNTTAMVGVPDLNLAYTGAAEAFFATCLGGRAEPILEDTSQGAIAIAVLGPGLEDVTGVLDKRS